jgi:hypothetical protein
MNQSGGYWFLQKSNNGSCMRQIMMKNLLVLTSGGDSDEAVFAT